MSHHETHDPVDVSDISYQYDFVCANCNRTDDQLEEPCPNPKPKMITITQSEYDSLVAESDKLAALEAYGVDNWVGYYDAINDVEGILE